jgi:magnesium transporter
LIQAFVLQDGKVERHEIGKDEPLPAKALWLDIVEPTPVERSKVEAVYGLALPTREDVREIEPSDRLYVENGVRFMTATILVHADAPVPKSESMTFIIAGSSLITLRYVEPRPVSVFATRLLRGQEVCSSGEEALVGLMEAFVDRIADVLEKVALDLDHVSQSIFDDRVAAARGRAGPADLQGVLKALGRNDDLVSTVRESLLSLTRLIRFYLPTFPVSEKSFKEVRNRLKSARSDIASLNEHATFESHKINFLLDATLGMINIEQNRIIKIFSVVAAVFLPPTLIASIYGMNFKFIPELDWHVGYLFALALMVLSAVLPVIYFRRKGWL